MKVTLTEYAIENQNNPDIKWFINDEQVKNILSNVNKLRLCHIKSLKPSYAFTNEYVWDNVFEQPVAIFEYGILENLLKKFKRTRKKQEILKNNDLKILNIEVQIFNQTRIFKLFVRSEILPLFREFLNSVKDLSLDDNYMIFFNQNIDQYIYYTFGGLEKSIFLATIADRLFFVQNGILYINEFYLIHKSGEKVLIERQRIGRVNEIF